MEELHVVDMRTVEEHDGYCKRLLPQENAALMTTSPDRTALHYVKIVPHEDGL